MVALDNGPFRILAGEDQNGKSWILSENAIPAPGLTLVYLMISAADEVPS